MALLIKNANVYAPEHLGKKDILVVGEKIVAMEDSLTVTLPDLEIFDARGMTVTPGFIDQHIHVIGGGGEGGPVTRPPEIMLSDIIKVGTTSVVGVCGTDNVTRSLEALLAKTRALKKEGISVWMHTSNYAYPVSTITGSVRKDLFAIPECIGVKIALYDHRSSFPSTESVLQLLSDIRVGGMISGKTGFLHVHLGDIPGFFPMVDEIVARGMPIRHIRPTHTARNARLFSEAINFAKKGGYVDVTTCGTPDFTDPAQAIETAWDAGVEDKYLTFSSDGQGSCPRFNDEGVMVGIGVASVDCNLNEIRRLISRNYSVERALALSTRNPARALELPGKGELKAGFDADISFFDENWQLQSVIARGRVMMHNQEVIVKGTFEY